MSDLNSRVTELEGRLHLLEQENITLKETLVEFSKIFVQIEKNKKEKDTLTDETNLPEYNDHHGVNCNQCNDDFNKNECYDEL